MSQMKKPEEPILSCEICLREMPHDLVHTHEGPDYVLHFCGLDCYRTWQKRQEAMDRQREKSPDSRP